MAWAWRPRRRQQGRHCRLRDIAAQAGRAEGKADEALRRCASAEKRFIDVIESLALAREAPLGGPVPAELVTAIESGSREPVTLKVAGEPVVAFLDEYRPGEPREIWHAVTRVANGGEGLAAACSQP